MLNFLKKMYGVRWFTPKSVSYTFPEASELSDPIKCERPRELKENPYLFKVLQSFILQQGVYGPMTTHQFAIRTPSLLSHGQRLSELRKLGFLSAEKQDTEYGKRFVWSYTEKGYDAIYKK